MTRNEDGLQRWAPLAIAAGLLMVAMTGNLASTLALQARSGQPLTVFDAVLNEVSSGGVWLALTPLIARIFKRLTPPRVAWTAIVPLHAVAAPLVSLFHYGVTCLLRAIVHLAAGRGFDFRIHWNGYAGDLPGDFLTYVLAGLIYWGVESLLAARARGQAAQTAPSPVLEVRDGAHTQYLPIAEILWVEAAGNYVELHIGGRTVLMRATLASLAERLGKAGFVRIHRSRLANLAMIAAVENRPAGEASLELSTGDRLPVSRRYRQALFDAMGTRIAPQDTAPLPARP